MSETDLNIIIGQITRKILIVVVPVILLTIGGDLIKDHFTLKNKVDRTEWMEAEGKLLLLIEKKTRAIESLAKGNKKDIEHTSKMIEKLEEYQREIDKYLRTEFRERGTITQLPKY